jgi:hypothetical protein
MEERNLHSVARYAGGLLLPLLLSPNLYLLTELAVPLLPPFYTCILEPAYTFLFTWDGSLGASGLAAFP